MIWNRRKYEKSSIHFTDNADTGFCGGANRVGPGCTVIAAHGIADPFWQKHRDKLTVAGTAATGAGIGALTGGKKGAAIGTAVGAGSGALYTYKIRKRHRVRRRY